MKFLPLLLVAALVSCNSAVKIADPNQDRKLDYWVTRGDRSWLLQQQGSISFESAPNNFPFITVDSSAAFQTIDGFGFTLPGGSAQVIDQLDSIAKSALLFELFGAGSNAIGISYLRLSMGASDLDNSVFSYNDLPAGQTDPQMKHFSLEPDRRHLLPLLKKIIAINPEIKILATPWSPPVWMKDNGSTIGGSLKKEYYPAYANYFVKYVEEMEKEGIRIDAITPQNEPLHPGNNPSLLMLAADQATFIRDHLGPAFKAKEIKTKIIIYDHNCDRADYPLTVLNDDGAKQYIDGSAFHLYAGDINALSVVREAHPDKNIYFTEQYTSIEGAFADDLQWHIKNLIIGATRNWARTVLEWNLANDAHFGPHTEGGCTSCKGALTISDTAITRNVSYYVIAHAAKFVRPNSVRISSNEPSGIPNVAFRTGSGEYVLIVLNESKETATFNIRIRDKWATVALDAGAVGTFIF